MAVEIKSQVKQFLNECEREKITQTIILVHSLPELLPVPRKPLGIPLGNQQQITTHHNLKEVILTTQEYTPSFTSYTHY